VKNRVLYVQAIDTPTFWVFAHKKLDLLIKKPKRWIS
jgi:hypothetical protein